MVCSSQLWEIRARFGRDGNFGASSTFHHVLIAQLKTLQSNDDGLDHPETTFPVPKKNNALYLVQFLTGRIEHVR